MVTAAMVKVGDRRAVTPKWYSLVEPRMQRAMSEASATELHKPYTAEQSGVLTTKLFAPRPLEGFIPRRRLLDALDAGIGRGLIVVCAPAGSGKTALLADWARTGRRPIGWVSLDAGDNDPARFWRHLAVALDGRYPGIAGRVTSLLGPPTPTTFDGLAAALINALTTDPLFGEAALILDDYHVIDSQLVHASLTYLIEH